MKPLTDSRRTASEVRQLQQHDGWRQSTQDALLSTPAAIVAAHGPLL